MTEKKGKKEDVEETKKISKEEIKEVSKDVKKEDKKNVLENVPKTEVELSKSIKVTTSDWTPKTSLGKKIISREITNIDEILDNGLIILEAEIVDELLELDSELLLIGQAKGKFGGGQRRAFRQTQKKTKEGNKPHFSTVAVVGNKNGYVGIGYGKSKETIPAREKSLRNAKLNIFKITRGSGSWASVAKDSHSIPFAVMGKEGSVKVQLMPAPKGTGLCVEKEIAKILQLAGIEDVWSKTQGQTKSKFNLIRATEKALRKLTSTKVTEEFAKNVSLKGGVKE